MKFGTTLRFFLLVSFALSTNLAQADSPTGAGENKQPTAGKKPIVKVKHTSLYKNSHIIAYKGQHTIIPKSSILFLPDKLKSRIVEKPTGKFVLWPFFKQSNQSWIWIYEVSLDQAKGKKPLPKGKMEQFQKLNRMVVAQFRRNPVSVLKPKEKEDKNPNKSTKQ